MTHGRNVKPRVNRRSEKSRSLLTRVSEKQEKSLESRVTRLEARIEQMQEEIDRASGVMPAHIREALDSIGKKHPGPSKKVDDTELVLNRENLIVWLEEHWLWIIKPLLAAGNPREVAAVLRPFAAAREIRPTWQKAIVGHPAKLREFLQSGEVQNQATEENRRGCPCCLSLRTTGPSR